MQPAISAHGKGHPVEEMANQRIGDYEGFKDYQRAVFSRTQAHLESMDPNDFLRVVIAKPYPPEVATTYSARCAGDAGITVLDARVLALPARSAPQGRDRVGPRIPGSVRDDGLSEAAVLEAR